MYAYALYWQCVCTILCVCVFVHAVYVCFCHTLYENVCSFDISVCFVYLYTIDLCNYRYLHIVCFSLSCKALQVSERAV